MRTLPIDLLLYIQSPLAPLIQWILMVPLSPHLIRQIDKPAAVEVEWSHTVHQEQPVRLQEGEGVIRSNHDVPYCLRLESPEFLI